MREVGVEKAGVFSKIIYSRVCRRPRWADDKPHKNGACAEWHKVKA